MFPEYLNNISRFLKFFLIFATFHVSYKDVSYIKNEYIWILILKIQGSIT